jgi:molybdopterin biosynthesis enzyme
MDSPARFPSSPRACVALDRAATLGQISMMVAQIEPGQRITRLTPLADALAAIDALVRPVEPRETDTNAALGRTLAADACPAAAQPAAAIALRDGWAVSSDETGDAGSYAPAVLSRAPPRLNAGQPMPMGTDAVAPFDAVVFRGKHAEAIVPVAPGEGVLPAGADAAAGNPLRRAGERLRSIDRAVLIASGVSRLTIREPRIRLVRARTADDAVIAAGYAWLAGTISDDGAVVVVDEAKETVANDLEAALHHEGSDAVVVLGGTGSGSTDASVHKLAQVGRVEFHGVGLIPGETAGFGFAGARPVLLVPGRIDAALAVWLAIGRRWTARLAARTEQETAAVAELSRKVTSTLGMAEVVPVRRAGGTAEPLAGGYLSFSALARADGWILIPADSEGYPAGARVAVRSLT